jgi:NitT/TauT family transport system substrate-binding protein
MNYSRKLVFILLIIALVLAGCSISVVSKSKPAVNSLAAGPEKWTLYTPASTSSIPVILAAEELGNVDLVLYNNQEQANTLFARGEISVLVTGLSVGVDLYRNKIPLQMVNTCVSGLSYLVSYGETINSFADLKGEQIYIPFAGSPIEEVSQYLAAREGLKWSVDITPVYSPFDSSIALLKQGKAKAVILPEPNVSLIEDQPNIYISFSLYDLWNENRPGDTGYPQVGAFANPTWIENHAAEISSFNAVLERAIAQVQSDPASAINRVKDRYKLPQAVLQKALERTQYQLYTGSEMQQAVENYYQVVGKPLDENYAQLFYISEK